MNNNYSSNLSVYVKKQVSEGQSLATIKSALLGNGWEERKIDEAINNLYPRTDNNPIKKKPAKLLFVLLIATFILSGSGATYYLYQKNNTRITNNQTEINALPLDISGWKTYTNQKYKYSFQYPPNWEVEGIYASMIRLREIGKKGETITLQNQNNQKIEAPAPYDLVINASDIADPDAIEKYIQNVANDSTVSGMTFKTSAIMVDKKQATKVITYFNNAEFTTAILLLSGNTMYDFLTMNDDPGNVGIVASDAATIQANKDNSNFKNTQIVDQIISTFRLIVQE